MEQELIQEIKKCKSVEELITSAEKKGKKLSKEEATSIFNRFNAEGKLADDELNNVAGGSSCDPRRYDKVKFYSESEVTFVAQVGDIVEMYKDSNCGTATTTGKIRKTSIEYDSIYKCYYDKYQVNLTFDKENTHGCVCKTVYRSSLQKP